MKEKRQLLPGFGAIYIDITSEMISDYVYTFSSCIFRLKTCAQRAGVEIVSPETTVLTYCSDTAVDYDNGVPTKQIQTLCEDLCRDHRQ